MSYWIYSTEALPNVEMMGKPGYTPDSEYIRFGGITLPPIPKKKWTLLPDSFTTIKRADWRDRHGMEVEIPIKKFKGVIDARFLERGVIFLDHEPSDAEKTELKMASEQLNLSWRRKCIQFYENQVAEKQTTGKGRTTPTPYEDECYELLGMKKPYSVDALQAQRDPGKEAADKIAQAIAKGREADARAIAEAVRDVFRPTETPQVAIRR